MESFFAVLNPGGRDKAQVFLNGAGSPSDGGHPPVNYHAYAACCRGGFYRSEKEIPAAAKVVLVLIRRNGLDATLRAIRALKPQGRKVWISWKESGLHQVAEALADPWRVQMFRSICAEADGFLSSTQDLVPLYQSSGCAAGRFVPTPYPVEEPAWNFETRADERTGVFVGTREFYTPSRNHHLAVSVACSLGHPVTVINEDGGRGERMIKAVSPEATVVNGRLPYGDYLRLMARHRLVLQFDSSAVPGQVAGDAALCRLPCVGGNGAIDRLAFSENCSFAGNTGEVRDFAARLLEDDGFYRQVCVKNHEDAVGLVSFTTVHQQLLELAG